MHQEGPVGIYMLCHAVFCKGHLVKKPLLAEAMFLFCNIPSRLLMERRALPPTPDNGPTIQKHKYGNQGGHPCRGPGAWARGPGPEAQARAS